MYSNFVVVSMRAACDMVTETECKELKAQMLRKLGVRTKTTTRGK